MTGGRSMIIKFGIFATVMALLTVFLFFTFGQYRTGSTNGYSAVFSNASRLAVGDTFFVYPTKLREYQGRYRGSFLHGGVTPEECILPLALLTPR